MNNKIVIAGNDDKNIWNLAANHPMQTWEWGEARISLGTQVVRFMQKDRDSHNKVFQITIHPIPHTPFKIGYLPRSVMPDNEMLSYLKAYAIAHGLLFIKIEPDSAPTSSLSPLLITSPHPLFPSWSLTMDLSSPEDVLLKKMKTKTRYNIRLAQKKGVTVKEMDTEEGFAVFAQLYFETCKRQRYFGHTKTYHHTIWQHLKDTMAHLLIAYVDTEPVAAYELFYHKNILYYPYGGTSEKHRNLMGANLIMWEAIRLGKKLGATKFDMWGSLAPDYPEDHPWAGFTRFKEGYGAVFTPFAGSFDLVTNKNAYTTYNLLYRLRGLYLSIRKSI